MTFDKPGSVDKAGANYFRIAGAQANPSPATDVEVHQSNLERKQPLRWFDKI